MQKTQSSPGLRTPTPLVTESLPGAMGNQQLAAFSHEMQTPLNAILELARQALDTELTEEQREQISNINTAAQYLLGILRNLLLYFKMGAGRLELESVPFTIGRIFSMQRALFGEKTSGKGVALHFTIAEDVPAMLAGDFLRLSEVLCNLLSNAVKFTHQGEVHVRCTLVDRDVSSALLHFEVRDTGIGMSAEEQGRIFDAYSQANKAIGRLYGGTGLGLSIAKRIVETMGGEIAVQSEEGRGTCIFFTCRLGIVCAIRARPKEAASDLFSGQHVLVVDDSDMNREIIRTLLEDMNLRVSLADNGLEALALLDAQHGVTDISLILLDLEMPVLNGFQTMEGIRARQTLRSLPVIAMSAASKAAVGEACRLAGMRGYLEKPIDLAELQEILHRFLLRDAA